MAKHLPVTRKRLILVIDLENSAFETNDFEAERLLADTADRKGSYLQKANFGDHLIDINGNKVGEWIVLDGDEPARKHFEEMLEADW